MRFKNIFFKAFLLIFVIGFFKSQSQSDFYISDSQGNQNPIINCSYPFVNGDCLQLMANYPQFKLTDQYNVVAKSYTPYTSANKTIVKQNLDDFFTSAIDLPFTFCFYGVAYRKIVIGSNGMISFDITQANLPNAPNFVDTLPNQNLPKQAVFGVLHDMYFSTSNDSEISYSVIGTAPFRKFVVDFYKGRLSGCDTQTSTSQIVLSEGSNTIEVFVENKEIPCNLAKYRNSLIGINDGTGNLGISAPGRNTGIWSATNEAWIFSPAGNNLVPNFIWYDSNGNVIGNAKDQIVCPNIDETYKVDIIYTTCNGATSNYSDDIVVKFALDYPNVKNYTETVCNVSAPYKLADYKQFLINNNSALFDFVFTDTSTGLVVNENTIFSLTADKTFSVKVSSKADPNCFKETFLYFKFFTGSLLTNTLEVCDMLNDKIEANFLLSKFNIKLLPANYIGSISYFDSQTDALSNTNPILNKDLVDGAQLWIRLSYQSCANVFGPITIKFNNTPVVSTPVTAPQLNICDSKSDGVEPFDWESYLRPLITTDPLVSSIKAYTSLAGAMSGITQGLTTISAGQYKIYARVEYPGGCFSIAEVIMDVVFGKISLRNSDKFICFDGTQDITINLDTLTQGALLAPLDGTVTGPVYYSDLTAANNADAAYIIAPNQIITDDGGFVVKTFYARYDKGTDCYSILPINIYLIHFALQKSSFDVCDIQNDGIENITLSIFDSRIVGAQQATVKYFRTQPEAIANVAGTEITTYNLVSGLNTVYARTDYYGCIDYFPITINLNKTPDIKNKIDAVYSNLCDNNANGSETVDISSYETSINFNNQAVEFSYFSDSALTNQYPDSKNITVSNGSIVYAKVKFKNSDCYSVCELNVKLNFLPLIILNKNAELNLCDRDFNFGERFDLADSVPQIFDANKNTLQLSDIKITYYISEIDANNGTAVGLISSPYSTSAALETVYARYQSVQYGCYSVAPINLNSYFPVKTKNSVITICDNNLDGFYDVNLLDYKDQMVQTPNAAYNYMFYVNQSDIGVPGKEIKNPSNFILNPYVSKIWVFVENLKDCGSFAEVNFKNGTQLTLNQYQFDINNICDIGNDGKENIDLSQFESTIGAYTFDYYESLQNMNNDVGKLSNYNPYSFDETKGISKIYVKVSQAGLCPNFYVININKLNKTPIITINDYYYCKNNTVGIEIRPNFTGLDVIYYKWELPDASIIQGANQSFLTGVKTTGTYKITLTNSVNCTYTTSFKVNNIDTPEIVSLTGQNNYYIVNATGITGKTILYSLDLVNWQTSNRFDNLKAGDYTFYVKYSDSDCHGDMRLGRIYTILNAITPNEDGYNDTWKLLGLNVFSENSSLEIYDKFGNLVYKQISNISFEWDGKSHGRNLPTDAYWYVIKAGDGRLYNGWILLKNRN